MSVRKRLRNNETTNVVIIGAGVIGLTIARVLARRGIRQLMLIERGRPGAEASWAAGGILAPQVEADHQDDFFQLACASRDLYPEFAESLKEETGVDVELDTAGTLCLGFTEKDEAELRLVLDECLVESGSQLGHGCRAGPLTAIPGTGTHCRTPVLTAQSPCPTMLASPW